MSIIIGLVFLIIVMIGVMCVPSFVKPMEGFESNKNILKTVGKDVIPNHTLFLNDYETGNAKRYLSKLPSVRNGGFSVPDDYTFLPVPKYHSEYKPLMVDTPRTSDINRGSHNDPVHIYFQKLYGTLEDADKEGSS